MDKNSPFYVGFFSGVLTIMVIGFIGWILNVDLVDVYKWNDSTGAESRCRLIVPRRVDGIKQKPSNCMAGPGGGSMSGINLPLSNMKPGGQLQKFYSMV